MRRSVYLILPILTAALSIFLVNACLAGGGPKNVIVVVNDNSSVSQEIGTYYQQKRGIPDYNVCHVRCSTAEYVSRAECESNVIAPIRSFLASYPIPGRIDYIVMTKGTPLKADYDSSYFLGPVSVASLLTCVSEPSIRYPAANPLDPNTCPPLVNPYGPTASPAAPEQYFSHQLSFNGRSFYAVTRLDAYSVADIYRMIDDGVSAQPAQGLFLLDDANSTSYRHISARLREANNALIAAGYQTYYNSTDFDARVLEFVCGQQGVMGYFSWGSNEPVTFTQEKYVSNYFLPGSIADTFVSYSGRTFTYPPSPGQSLIADLIPQGLSGCNGFVSEPNVNLATYPDVLFDRYLKGYNLAESFLAASPELYWKAVTIGDPLMAPYATPPFVAFASPQDGATLHGTVRISVDASDSSGVAKVEFCINDEPVAVCTSAPYEFEWDTSGCVEGPYVVEAIACENSAVYTQSLARLDVAVDNSPQSITRIGDLSSAAEGSLVRLTSKVVVAGTDVFTDCIYVCEADRTAGVKVIGKANAQTGSLVDVLGEKRTIDGQCVVRGATITVTGSVPVPAPLGMANRDVGARGSNGSPAYAALPVGLPSTSLLIRTWGQVQQWGDGCFYIADRSIRPPSGGTGRLKVSCTDMVSPIVYMPPLSSYVEVTCISALECENGELKPVLRPRTNSDIRSGLSLCQVTSPPGAVLSQWNLLSMPGVPVNPSAASVFPEGELDGNLYCWDVDVQTIDTYDSLQSDGFPPLCMGAGFWLQLPASSTVQVRMIVDQPNTDAWVSLPVAGDILFGYPFMTPRLLTRCRISDGLQTLSLFDAVSCGWLDSYAYFWEGGSGGVQSIDMLQCDESAVFEPWHGYQIRTLRPNLALILPYNPD